MDLQNICNCCRSGTFQGAPNLSSPANSYPRCFRIFYILWTVKIGRYCYVETEKNRITAIRSLKVWIRGIWNKKKVIHCCLEVEKTGLLQFG